MKAFTIIETDCLGNEEEYSVYLSDNQFGEGYEIVEVSTGNSVDFCSDVDEVEYFFDKESGCTHKWTHHKYSYMNIG